MGVPKFYRWISERYPKINQVITDAALLPEFDHLYLDMNGIIHGCTHPAHLDMSDTLSEKDMMLGIMHYLDRIITQIVKPQVSVFMAIDGVAPRAKLNQQRSRRFRSAKDMKEACDKEDGKNPNGGVAGGEKQEAFDSNCITPGTEFMERVSNCIKYFIRKKIKEDPLWRKLKIIYSGHEIPGEGEHKIMQHIRDMRSQPGYKPNTRHCMYGQDADLIMLGLVSHEPHFTLLREIVNFGNFQRNDNALKAVTKFTKQSDFQLLHLSILREYIAIDFGAGIGGVKEKAIEVETKEGEEDGTSEATTTELKPTSFDLEAVIDDWIFMTFLVGNDFLPHMPTLDISLGAFDLLFNTYKDQRPTWGEGGYLTQAGEIKDPARLEAFLAVIGAAETEVFDTVEVNQAEYIQKKRRWDKRDGRPQGPSDFELAMTEKDKQTNYQSMIDSMMEMNGVEGTKFVDGWKLPSDENKKDHKGRYYFEKLEFTPVDIDDHLALRQSYIEGLIWCLAYYYRGCISWGWFYPYHYGPLISDLTDLPNVFKKIKFEIGAPLKPFQQLMGCLPPASASIVPKPYRKLMTSPDSPILKFYPEQFVVDMNGKRNPWEGVNILPFIDIDLLKETLVKFCPDKVLNADEKRRNSPGKVYCYMYDAAMNDTVPSFNRDIGIKDIMKCKSKIHVLDEPSIEPTTSFEPVLIKGTQIPYPGFPSLNVLPMKSAELKPLSINCFGTASKYATNVLSLQTLPELPGAAELADNLLGRSLFINWPMMHEAKVVAVSDENCMVRTVKKKKKVVKHSSKDAQRWVEETELMSLQYLTGCGQPGSGGVDIGPIQIRLKMVSLQGMKVSPINGSSKKIFGTEEANVPLQMVLWQSPAPDPRFEERGPMTLKDRFPSHSNVVLTKGKYRGCTGSILSVVDDKLGVKVNVMPPEPPFGLAIARTVQESYISTNDAAKVLKMNHTIFSKITGSVFFQPGNYDLGLNLKYKRDFCVLGYTRRISRSTNGKKNEKKLKKAWGTKDTVLVVGNQRDETLDSGKKMIWEYAPKAVKLVAAFRKKFPTFFSVISKNPEARKYDARSLGPNGVKELSLIREWLNSIETAKMPRTPYTTQEMPHTAISALQRAADVRDAAMEKESTSKQVNLKIPAAALYLEGSTLPTDVLHHADGESPELGDRIVNLCANGLPFGVRGTIVGIHEESTGCVEVVMDKEFIGGSTLQGACSNFRGKLCVWNHLLKINPSNSMEIVEQIIPTGSGKSAIDNMLNLSVEDDDKVKAKNIDTSTNKDKNNQVSVKPQETQNAWKQPSPLKTRAGKQGAWREATGPSGNGIGFKGAGRGGKSGLHAWKKTLVSHGPTGAPKPDIPKPKKANSAEGLKAILGVKNVELKQNATDATVGLKNMLGIASSLPTVKPEAKGEQSFNAGPTSAADALMQLMVQAPSNIVHAPPPPPQQSSFNFTYVSEGDKKPPSSGGQSIAHPPVLYPNGPNGVYHSPMTHQMHYPTMIGQPMMMPPQPQTMNGPVENDSTLPKKEQIAVKEAPLIPSVTVKAKK